MDKYESTKMNQLSGRPIEYRKEIKILYSYQHD